MRARLLAVVLAVLAVGGCGDEPIGTPVTETGAGPIPSELASVEADVQRLAPALETWARDHGYATTLAEALAQLEDAALAPTPPNVVGGYELDAAAQELTLCVESPSGVHASYDTRPMALQTSGASGGCASG